MPPRWQQACLSSLWLFKWWNDFCSCMCDDRYCTWVSWSKLYFSSEAYIPHLFFLEMWSTVSLYTQRYIQATREPPKVDYLWQVVMCDWKSSNMFTLSASERSQRGNQAPSRGRARGHFLRWHLCRAWVQGRRGQSFILIIMHVHNKETGGTDTVCHPLWQGGDYHGTRSTRPVANRGLWRTGGTAAFGGVLKCEYCLHGQVPNNIYWKKHQITKLCCHHWQLISFLLLNSCFMQQSFLILP